VDYFTTNWSAMTSNDWLGLILTVVVFFLMLGAYFYAFRPKNRKYLEKQKFIPLDDD
jgi:cbb3-type cytochrome oxidase subunit 3